MTVSIILFDAFLPNFKVIPHKELKLEAIGGNHLQIYGQNPIKSLETWIAITFDWKFILTSNFECTLYTLTQIRVFSIFRIFPDISPIFDFTGISGKNYRGNRVNCGKTGRYFIAISLSYVLPKTEWKNLFPNSSYLIFTKKPVFGPNPAFWWRHHRTHDVISIFFISACCLYDGPQTWKVSSLYASPVKSYGGYAI